MKKQVLYVDSDGTMRGLHESLAMALQLRVKRRYSRIEPANRRLRVLFYKIRTRVRDDSFLAKTTRIWPVLWQVRICDTGQHLGYFWSRRKAHDAEKNYYERAVEHFGARNVHAGGDPATGEEGAG